MTEAGYTLTEILVAMTLIGVAIGGGALGVQVIGDAQMRLAGGLARFESVRAAGVALERRLSARGAIRSVDPDRLSGASQRLQFSCVQSNPCEVRLVAGAPGQTAILRLSGSPEQVFKLGPATHPRFLYSGSDVDSPVWPPTDGTRQVLKAISVVADEGPVLVARLRAEQPAACDFDVVLKDCR